MISSRRRVGSWSYLKWGDIIPIILNDSIIAVRIKVLDIETSKYYASFITNEAYLAIKDWMDFRQSFGENIIYDSWIMRNLWQIKSKRYGNYLGLAKHPTKSGVDRIRMLINDIWKVQGVRENTKCGNRYCFKELDGFWKFFETETQKVMKSINISILVSHDTGIVQHYYKPMVQIPPPAPYSRRQAVTFRKTITPVIVSHKLVNLDHYYLNLILNLDIFNELNIWSKIVLLSCGSSSIIIVTIASS